MRRAAPIASAMWLLLFVANAAAQDVLRLDFGFRVVFVPAPAGFIEGGKYFPEIRQAFAAILPPALRLEGVYITVADLKSYNEERKPALDRTYQLQIPVNADGRRVSYESFGELAGDVEASFLRSPPAGLGAVAIDRREPWGLFFTAGTGGTSDAPEDWAGGAVVLVGHQILLLYHFVDASIPGARGEAHAGVLAWAESIRRRNPDAPFDTENAGSIDIETLLGVDASASASNSRAPFSFGYLLGIALFLYLVYRFFFRRK